MKNLILVTLTLMTCYLPMDATLLKTNQIEEIKQEIGEETLVLFNIAEVLMDTETMLGTQAWRKYIRSRVTSKLHDEWTLYVFKHVPPQAVEPTTAEVIHQLQERGVTVLAFTSRGRHEWYSSQVADVDLLTEELLRQIGIDFSFTALPPALSSLDSTWNDYYHAGIIYATNAIDKGDLLVELFETTAYQPTKIVFIDDKIDSLKTVEKAVERLEIPFTGYAYGRTAQEHANFDPMIANIQFDWLISYGQLLSDQEAANIKIQHYLEVNPDDYFKELIEKWHSLKIVDP